MAALTFKRTGFGSGPRGRKATISDPAMSRVLNSYKASYGQVPAGAADPQTGVVPMRDMTDDEVTDKLFDGIIQGMLDAGDANARSVASITASAAITKTNATVVADNT